MIKKFLIGTFAIAALAFAMTASASYDFGATTLKVGSKGDYVKTLQTLVGASPVDGIFGNGTKAKVMAWQATNGLTADGLFGGMSKAKANLGLGGTTGTLPAGCTAGALFSATTGQACGTTVTTPGSFTLGGEGEVANFDINAEDDALASSDDQTVATIEFEVEDGDVVLEKVDLYFEETTVNNDLWENIKSIKLISDGKEISDIDVSNDDDWKDHDLGIYSIGLTGKTVFKDGDNAEIEVVLETTNEVETGDADEVYSLWAELRFSNSAGVLMYEGGDEDDDSDAVVFEIQPLGAFDISYDENNNSPEDDKTLDLSSSATETLVVVDAEIGEDQGGTLEDATVILGVNLASGTADVDDLIDQVEFYIDGKKVDSDDSTVALSVGANAVTYTFDLDNMDVDAEDTIKIEVKAAFNDIEDDSDLVGAVVKVNSIKITGESQEGDNFTGPTETTSYAPLFTVTAGAIDVTFTEDPEATATGDYTGSIAFTVRVENNTGATLSSMLTAGTWKFEVKGYGGLAATTITGGSATLSDGDDDEYDVTMTYASKSTAKFSVEVKEIANIPVAEIWVD